MSDRWESLDSGLRLRLECLRGIFTVSRLCRFLLPGLALILLLRLGWSYRLYSETVLAGLAVVVMGLTGGLIIRFWSDLSLTRRETVRELARRDSEWEPLRALLLRPEGGDSHPYFDRALREEIRGVDQSTGLFNLIVMRERLFVTLGLFALIGLLLVPAIPRTTQSGPTQPRPAVQLSADHRLRGDTVTVEVTNLNRHQRPEITLFQGSKQRRVVRPEWEDGIWRWRSFPLDSTIELRARLGNRSSQRYRVPVVDQPDLTVQPRRVSPPAYTGLSDRADPSTPLEILPGSQVTLRISANRPMATISIRSPDLNRERVEQNRSSVTLSDRVTEQRQYVVTAVDTYGFRADTVTFGINTKRDAPPRVELRKPDPEKKVEGSGLLPLRAWFNDDFGLSRARVSYGRTEVGAETRVVQVPENQSEGELYGQIDRDAVGLMTGDTFQFQLTVWDNDVINGPKSATAGPFTLQVFSWAEMMQQRENKLSQGTDRLSQMQETVERLRSELQEMARNQEAADWEMARKLQEAQKSLDRQQKQLQQARKNLQQYQEGGEGLSRDSLEKLKEVREMAQEYGMERLRSAQDSVAKAVRDQLENNEFSREDLEYSSKQLKSFERNIERMHDYLKKAEPALKMDEMAKTLQSMSEEQKNWSRDGEWSGQDKRELERQAEQWDWMKKQLKQLEGKTEGEVKKQVQQLRKQLSSENMASRARNMSKQSSPSDRQRQQYREKTREMRNKMRQTLQQQSGQMAQQKRNLRSKLVDYWTEWYAELQSWGDDLRTMDVPPRFAGRFDASMQPLNDAMSRTTELQKGLAYLGQLTRQIGRMSTSFPRDILETIPEHERRLSSGLKSIQQRRIGQARRTADQLQKSQARLIKNLLEWSPSQQGQQSQSSSGGSQSLSQLLNQQRRLMQSMMPMMGSGKMSQSLAQQYLQQQRMIRRGLQQLANRQQQNKDVLGDLESITRDMRESEEKMADREFDKTLESKQRTILKRLEQATKSLSEEDTEKQRQSQQRVANPGGSDTVPVNPSDYQAILDRIGPELSDLDASEREAVLRFYRYWYRGTKQGGPPQ